MNIEIEHIALLFSTLIAIWNIFLQIRLKRMEGKISSRNIKLQAITNHEYETYKILWEKISSIMRIMEFLRLELYSWNEKTNKTEFNKEGLSEFKNEVKDLEKTLNATAPFIKKEIVNSIFEIVRLAKLEGYQIHTWVDGSTEKSLKQSDLNNLALKKAYSEAAVLLRNRIIE